MMRQRNVEIKAKIRNLSKIIKKARELSESQGQEIQQHDTFFYVSEGRLKLREFIAGNAELIFYKRPDQEGPKLSNFEKAPITAESVADLRKVLKQALGTSGVVKKKRHLYIVGQTRIHIDSVEGLGDFMELEVVLPDEQSLEDGAKIAEELMIKLGVEKSDLVPVAYADLLKTKDD